MENKSEITIGYGDQLTVKSSKTVELRELLTLVDKKTMYLDVTITADLATVPEEYHEIFLNMLTSKYYNKVSFGDNPFSKCLPRRKKRWYHFWR
jgi:hypothetical protein